MANNLMELIEHDPRTTIRVEPDTELLSLEAQF